MGSPMTDRTVDRLFWSVFVLIAVGVVVGIPWLAATGRL